MNRNSSLARKTPLRSASPGGGQRPCRRRALSPKLAEAAEAAGRKLETCWRDGCGGLHLAPVKNKKKVAVRALDLDPGWWAASADQRFIKALREGPLPEARPDLGPCLIYTGGKSDNDYGQFGHDGGNDYAHRYAWERENGAIGDGLTVDHLCFVRDCVRLGHLELVDGPTNTRRAAEARKRCRNGHLYGEGNEVGTRRRRCAKCDTATRARGAQKRRRVENGLPDRSIKYDQRQVKEVVVRILAAEITIAQGAREIGCNNNYLGRRAWNAAKRAVFKRDGGLCVCCGREATDVQHRIRRGSGGSRDPKIAYGMSNLIAMCRQCHNVAESRDDRMHAMGMWLNTWQVPELESVMLASAHGSGITVYLAADGLGPDGAGYLYEQPEAVAA